MTGESLRRVRRFGAEHALAVFLVLVLGYMVVAPLVRLQSLALSDGGDAYSRALDVRRIGKTLRTTVQLATASVAIALTVGTVLAWMSVRLPRRWRWMSVLPILPIVMPPVANVVGWVFLLSPRVGFINVQLRRFPFFDSSGKVIPDGPIDVFTTFWIIVVTGLALSSFVYIFVRAGLSRVGFDLIEAARIGGASPTRAFVNIALPMIRPSLVYGGSIALVLGLGQFTTPLLLGQNSAVRTLTTEVYRLAGISPVDYGISAAIASPLLVVGTLIVFAQRFLLANGQRFVSDVGKGVGGGLRRARSAPFVIGAYGLVAVALPLAALAAVAFSPLWTGSIQFDTLTLENFRSLGASPSVVNAVKTTVFVATVSVVISLPLGYLVAEILHKQRSWRLLRSVLDVLVNLPLAVPAVVFGAGFLFTYTKPPFVLYGTNLVIILVYVTLMLPFSTRIQLASRIALGNSFEAAARVSGASLLRANLSIVVPMLRGALGGAAALTFVLLTHEFAASILVRSPQKQTMGTALYDFWTTSSYPTVAAMALVMCAITTLGVVVAAVIGGRSNTLDQL